MIARFGTVLLRRALQIGERRAERVAHRLCDEIVVILPDIRIIRERGRVILTGRGLRRRWLTDAVFRWLGRVLR